MYEIWPVLCAGCDRPGQGRLCNDCTPFGVHRVGVKDAPLGGTWALAGYDSGTGRALARSKQRGDRAIAVRLAGLFSLRLRPFVGPEHFTAIVPAPSARRTLLRRGFSVASVLARALSTATGVPLAAALHLAGGTQQARLGRAARKRNLKGRVSATRSVHGRVLLVDDVLTTGATATAAAAALQQAGAAEIWLATLTAVRDDPTWRDTAL